MSNQAPEKRPQHAVAKYFIPSNGGVMSEQASEWNRLCLQAQAFADSALCPQTFRGKPADCLIALQMAQRMQVDPMMLMQNTYVVHGRPGIETKFAIALCNSKKVFKGPIRFDLEKDTQGKPIACTAYAFDRETGDRLEETVTMEIAEAEGWTKQNGSKWKTIPGLMLKYRSAMWLIRTTCPEVLMGMQSSDELQDMDVEVVAPPRLEGSRSDQVSALLVGDDVPPPSDDAVSEFAPGGDEEAAHYVDRLTTSIGDADSTDAVNAILAEVGKYAGGEFLPEDLASSLYSAANDRVQQLETAKPAKGQLV